MTDIDLKNETIKCVTNMNEDVKNVLVKEEISNDLKE